MLETKSKRRPNAIRQKRQMYSGPCTLVIGLNLTIKKKQNCKNSKDCLLVSIVNSLI